MAGAAKSSNKVKIARRVVEVLEYFDHNHREATVMDIVRRYGRPQSSTSELLCGLVELGLLYKDPQTRRYSLAPRAALLGTGGQASGVRDGGLVRLADRLAARTGLSVGLFGRVGTNVQLVHWQAGPRAGAAGKLFGGMQEPLCDNAAGWLLLSTIAPSRCEPVLRRLNAEASGERKFTVGEMSARLRTCRETAHVRGPVGFGSRAEVLARLLPGQAESQPLAIGFVYDPNGRAHREVLLRCLDEAVEQCLASGKTNVEMLPTAA